jgi:hypothetical protein
MNLATGTLIGRIDSVQGSIVSVRLLDDIPTFLMVAGKSYRVGQIGAFVRIPLGYTNLYAVCTLVGAAAAPKQEQSELPRGRRWLSASLFGESIADHFERGVSQYPTIEDEVHLVTPNDMRVIYSSTEHDRAITLGQIAASSGIAGDLDLGRLVTRHCAVVGSTGAGKSNLMAILLEAIATQGYPAARTLVIDPHGEYGSAIGQHARVFRVRPNTKTGEHPLVVPFWALPFDELLQIGFGEMQPANASHVRDEITTRKVSSAAYLKNPPPEEVITADAPIPFSIKQLWFDLDDFERCTYADTQRTVPADLVSEGSPEKLQSNRYPAPSPGTQAPFAPKPRGISKQLDLLKSRLLDSRYAFLFSPGSDLTPDLDGKTTTDLATLVQSWVGHDQPITVLDVSGLPSDVVSTVVGTMVRIIYDTLFWAMDLPISGRQQPLLIVLEEAHLFLPEGRDDPAHRTIGRIAKEGRKYGVGLCVVTQRPVEIAGTVLSQCGTMISLRLTNSADRAKVQAAMPDDLGPLTSMLPSLRTGEGLVLGEAMPIPSRIRFFKASSRPRGDDPEMPAAWRKQRPDNGLYEQAVKNWRHQTDISSKEETDD